MANTLFDIKDPEELKKARNNGHNVRFLKPKMLYYITSINMDLGDPNANGVFLAPGGDPMNVKLQVRLVKVNFTTVADLFRKDDNSGVGFNADGQREDKEDFMTNKDPKNASPFV